MVSTHNRGMLPTRHFQCIQCTRFKLVSKLEKESEREATSSVIVWRHTHTYTHTLGHSDRRQSSPAGFPPSLHSSICYRSADVAVATLSPQSNTFRQEKTLHLVLLMSTRSHFNIVDRRVCTDTHTRKLSTVYLNNHQPVSHFAAIIQIQDFKLYSYICAFISFVGDGDVQ